MISEKPLDQVAPLLERIGAEVVMPRFNNLSTEEKQRKPGEGLVTVADLEAEEALKKALTALVPGAQFVGEETIAEEPGGLALLREPGPVWVVDPIDGTGNFAAGKNRFCMMVALREGGRTVAAWVHLPLTGQTAEARRGAGAWFEGRRLKPQPIKGIGQARTAFALRKTPQDFKEQIKGRLHKVHSQTDYFCAGHAYLDQALGHIDAAFFYSTKPWDHLSGELLLQEAGGVMRFLNGAPYDPASLSGMGLLSASSAPLWADLAREVFGASD